MAHDYKQFSVDIERHDQRTRFCASGSTKNATCEAYVAFCSETLGGFSMIISPQDARALAKILTDAAEFAAPAEMVAADLGEVA